MNKALFMSVLKSQTAKLAAMLVPSAVVAGGTPLTDEERKIREAYLAIDCGGSRASYRRTVEKQFDADKRIINPATFKTNEVDEAEKHKVVPFSVFVPLNNPNGHDYTMGIPAVYPTKADDALRTDEGYLGNWMSKRKDSKRVATEKEMEVVWPHATRLLKSSGLRLDDWDLFDAEDTPENVEKIVAKIEAGATE